MEMLTAQRFYKDNRRKLKLKLLNESVDLNREIKTSRLNNPGLELAGFWEHFIPNNIQILTVKELKFLKETSERTFESIFKKLFSYKIPCLIFVNNIRVDDKVLELANEENIPIFVSKLDSTQFMNESGPYLYKEFAPRIIMHGSLMDIYGVGILFTGRSGIGKSEIALDLVERGHRLVADDVVNIEKASDNVLMGFGEELLQNTIEIRGVGIVNIRKAFGIRAVRTRKRVELQIELVEWNDEENYERFGIETIFSPILDIDIPFVKLPIYPGKNITVIAEVIALNYLLKLIDEDPAKELQSKLQKKIRQKAASMDDKRFRGDFE